MGTGGNFFGDTLITDSNRNLELQRGKRGFCGSFDGDPSGSSGNVGKFPIHKMRISPFEALKLAWAKLAFLVGRGTCPNPDPKTKVRICR